MAKNRGKNKGKAALLAKSKKAISSKSIEKKKSSA